MRVSIITVVFNAEKYLRDCIRSVLAQDYKDVEYILIDGGSTDQSYQVAKEYQEQISILFSEPDKGMYDALNKGILLATGDVIGILNADDILAAEDVVSEIVKKFEKLNVDAVYGDLNYVARDDVSKVIRKWRSAPVKPKALALGWMPAHPTLYLKASLFKQFGAYQLDYGSAADYELMLRYLYKYEIATAYLPKLMVNMRNGGLSNRSIKQRYDAFFNDYTALKYHQVPLPLLVLLLKKLRKIKQFF